MFNLLMIVYLMIGKSGFPSYQPLNNHLLREQIWPPKTAVKLWTAFSGRKLMACGGFVWTCRRSHTRLFIINGLPLARKIIGTLLIRSMSRFHLQNWAKFMNSLTEAIKIKLSNEDRLSTCSCQQNGPFLSTTNCTNKKTVLKQNWNYAQKRSLK